jgi:hypothetical protein
MDSSLKEEFQFYLDRQTELVEEHEGKVIVIKGAEVLGVYDDVMTAIDVTRKSHRLGTFLVQQVTRGNSAYTQSFHSRVVFS